MSSSLTGILRYANGLTLIVCDQDKQKRYGNLPAAELAEFSKQSIYLGVSDDLRVLRIGQGRGEGDVRSGGHGVERLR